MTASVYQAAKGLLALLRAPPGSVNTLGCRAGDRSVIRVLVDPAYMTRLGAVPAEFEGYDVLIERRGQVIPQR